MIKDIYFKQAQLVLQLLPFVMKHDHFALKGGSAINFFVRDLPRLSIDIDLTYIPLENRTKSIENISNSLKYISRSVKKAMRNIRIVPKILPDLNLWTISCLAPKPQKPLSIQLDMSKRRVKLSVFRRLQMKVLAVEGNY